MNKFLILSAIVMMLTFNCVFASEASIELSNDAILINGEVITNDEQKDIYLQNIIETHPDVSEESKREYKWKPDGEWKVYDPDGICRSLS